MPITPPLPQAHESPLIRIRARFADGRLHQFTISSTWRPTPELAQSEGYQSHLRETIGTFFASRGVEVLQVAHLNAASVEIGQ